MERIDLRHSAVVVSNDPICADHHLLVLREDTLPRVVRPGQFVNIRIHSRAELLLRRPFSVALAKPEASLMEIVYRVVGKGTAAMTALRPGEGVDLLGPLGKGFTLPKDSAACLLVGGGCGVAPLWGVADHLHRTGGKMTALLGFQTADKVFGQALFDSYHARLIVTTDDGSYGLKGFVSDHLEGAFDGRIDRAYVCGPVPMLKAVAPVLEKAKIPCEVSLEARMGCGFGVCLSCVVPGKIGDTIEKQRVCVEGPVFDLKDIVLEDED